MAVINLGRIVYLWQGDYSAAQTYARYDTCRYQDKVYICISDALANEDPVATPAKWGLMTEGASGMTTGGDILYHDGTIVNRLPAGTDGQALVMSGGMPGWGSGGKLVNVTHFEDVTRRTGLAGNNINWFQNLTLCTKQKAGSLLWVTGHIPIHNGSGNNVSVPVLTIKDGTNSHEVVGYYQQVTTSQGGYLSFNAIVPESGSLSAGAVQVDLYVTSYNATGNAIAASMNPTNSDDARLYPAGDARQWVTRFTVMEFEQ